MTEPADHTLRLLREIRSVLETLSTKIDSNHSELTTRMDNLRQAAFGESVLGRYAAAEVGERPDTLQKRIAALEQAQN